MLRCLSQGGIAVILWIIAALPGSHSAQAQTGFGAVVWSGSSGGNGHSYEIFHAPEGITWNQAEANAVSLGGHLASVHSDGETAFLLTLAGNFAFWQCTDEWQGPWIGGIRTRDGTWCWSDGTHFDYTNWYSGRPRNYAGVEDHIQFHGTDGMAATWGDANGNNIYPVFGEVASAYPASSLSDSYIVEWTTLPVGYGPTTWGNGRAHNGYTYEAFLAPDGITWSAAEANAAALGGHLASIHSAEENAFVLSLVENPSLWWTEDKGRDYGPWLGGSQTQNGWSWSDGTPFDYSSWDYDQPNGIGGNTRFSNYIPMQSTWSSSAVDGAYPNFPPGPLSHSYVVEWTSPAPPNAQPAGGGVVTWSGSAGGNGNRYEAFHAPSQITWSAAEANAVALGGHLASIHSGREEQFVGTLANNPSYCEAWGGCWRIGPWIGGELQSGAWQWSDGTSFDYSDWYPGQPDNFLGVEDHIQFFGLLAANQWNDFNGDDNYPQNYSPTQLTNSYLVEWPPASFTPQAGAFFGVASDGSISWNLCIDGTGGFRGSLAFASGSSDKIEGYADSHGFATGETSNGHRSFTLLFTDSSSGASNVSGTVNGTAITAYSILQSGTQGILQQGRYTLMLVKANPTSDLPPGTGCATLTVGNRGGASISGILADGQAFTTCGTLVTGSDGPQLLIGKELIYPHVTGTGTAKGFLFGKLIFSTVQGVQSVNGTLQWTRPTQAKGNWPASIDAPLTVVGSAYKPPAENQRYLPGFTTGNLILSGTGISVGRGGDAFFNNVSLDQANRLIITSDDGDSIRVTVNRSSGMFQGTFRQTIPGTTSSVLVRFHGVLMRDQNLGAGFFIGSSGAGLVSLLPW